MGGIGLTAMGEVHAVFALPIPDAQRPTSVLELYRRTAGGFAALEYASAEQVRPRSATDWRRILRSWSPISAALKRPLTRGMVAMQLGISADVIARRLTLHG
jgi:hypothetical protein